MGLEEICGYLRNHLRKSAGNLSLAFKTLGAQLRFPGFLKYAGIKSTSYAARSFILIHSQQLELRGSAVKAGIPVFDFYNQLLRKAW